MPPKWTFHPTRNLAMSASAYESSNVHQILIARDCEIGNGSKEFAVVPRHEVVEMMRLYHCGVVTRNEHLYIVVDPLRWIEPYFDIDVNLLLPQNDKWRNQKSTLLVELLRLLGYLFAEDGSTDVTVLDSSTEQKYSFHIHLFSMTHSNRSITTISEFKLLVGSGIGQVADPHCVRQFIDQAVYNKWQCLRLPYSSKLRNTAAAGLSSVFFKPYIDIDEKIAHLSTKEQMHFHYDKCYPNFESALVMTTNDPKELQGIVIDEEKIPNYSSNSTNTTQSFSVISNVIKEAALTIFHLIDPVHYICITTLTYVEKKNVPVIGYYIRQKTSRWCLKQQREHRDTYGQLYVTQQCVYFRCYSNDCHQSCFTIPWRNVVGGQSVYNMLFM